MGGMVPKDARILPQPTTLTTLDLNHVVKQVHTAFANQAGANRNASQLGSSTIRPRSVADLDKINTLLPNLDKVRQSTIPSATPALNPIGSTQMLTNDGNLSPYKVDRALFARANTALNLAEQQRVAAVERTLGESEPKLNEEESLWVEKRKKTFVANIEARRREVQRDEAFCKRFRTYNLAGEPDPAELLWNEGEFKELLDEFYGPDKIEPRGEMDMYESYLDEVDMIITSPPAPEPESPMTVYEELTLEPTEEQQCADKPNGNNGVASKANPVENQNLRNLFKDLGGVGTGSIDLDGFTVPPDLSLTLDESWMSTFLNLEQPVGGFENVEDKSVSGETSVGESHPVNIGTGQYLAYNDSGQLILLDGEPEAEYLAKRFPDSHINPSALANTPSLATTARPTAAENNVEREAALRLALDSLPKLDISPTEVNYDFTDAEFAATMAEVEQMDFSGIDTSTPFNTNAAPSNNYLTTQANPFSGNLVSLPGPFTRMLATQGNTGNTSYMPKPPIGAIEYPPLAEENIYIGDKVFDCRTGREILPSTHASSSPDKFVTPNSHFQSSPQHQPQSYDYNSPATPTPKPRPGRPRTSDFLKIVDRRTPSGSPDKNVQNVFAALGQPMQAQGRPFKTQSKETETSKNQETNLSSSLPKKVRAKPSPLFVEVPKSGMVNKENSNSQQQKRPASNGIEDGTKTTIENNEPPTKRMKYMYGGAGGGGRYVECDPNEPEPEPSKKTTKPRVKRTKTNTEEGVDQTLTSNPTETKKKRVSVPKKPKKAGEIDGGDQQQTNTNTDTISSSTATEPKKKRASSTKKPKKAEEAKESVNDTQPKDATQLPTTEIPIPTPTTTTTKKRPTSKKKLETTQLPRSDIHPSTNPTEEDTVNTIENNPPAASITEPKKKRAPAIRKSKKATETTTPQIDTNSNPTNPPATKKRTVGRPRKPKPSIKETETPASEELSTITLINNTSLITDTSNTEITTLQTPAAAVVSSRIEEEKIGSERKL